MKKLTTLVTAAAVSAALVLGANTATATEATLDIAETTAVVSTTDEMAATDSLVSAEETATDATEDISVVDATDAEPSRSEKLATAWKVIKWIGFGAAFLVGGIPGAAAYAPILAIGS